jgi:hypothetical protein
MGILKGILKVALSPLNGVKEIVDDLQEENGEEAKGVAILSAGVSSVVKGTAKGIKEGVEEIFK